VDAICAPAATFDGDGTRRNEDGGGFPSLAAPLLDRGREYRWGVAAEVNLVPRAGRPPPLYIAQYDGPTNHVGLGALDQGARNKAQKAVGPNGGRSKPNTPDQR
jgi:hypothetical protein